MNAPEPAKLFLNGVEYTPEVESGLAAAEHEALAATHAAMPPAQATASKPLLRYEPQAREVLHHPHDALSARCVPAEPGLAMRRLLGDMVATMLIEGGHGLAANQIGHNVRAIVFMSGDEKKNAIGCLNPRIVKRSGIKVKSVEGCLSAPGLVVTKRRAASITVEAMSALGNVFMFEVTGLEAAVVQHEIDHLDGKGIWDDA